MKWNCRILGTDHRWTCRVAVRMLAAMSHPDTAVPAPTSSVWLNPGARGWTCGHRETCQEFHTRLPGYTPTPLRDVPDLARRLGVGTVLVKDESRRLDLPAFKILGASWGSYRALCQRMGEEPHWDSLAELAARVGSFGGLHLVAATAGNHGRAVARMAHWLGLPSTVLVPSVVSDRKAAAIAGEGATVRRTDESYDQAVRMAADLAAQDDRYVLVQDTSWPGYEQVPAWIIDGYRTLFAEIDEQVTSRRIDPPDLVVVPVGVGSLLSAAVQHFRVPTGPTSLTRPALLAVEPTTAACLLTSLRAGSPVVVPTGTTVMEGLNAGTVSSAAWPLLRDGLDAAVAVTDEAALAAGRELGCLGVDAGACGAATLAGVSAVLSGPDGDTVRQALGLTARSTVILVSTDGPTAADS